MQSIHLVFLLLLTISLIAEMKSHLILREKEASTRHKKRIANRLAVR